MDKHNEKLRKQLFEKLDRLGRSFEPFLYESNMNVVQSLTKLGYQEDDIRRIELFDWFQGVGLYGYYKMYALTGNRKHLETIIKYFDIRIEDGLPPKNINAMAPMLTLLCLTENPHVDPSKKNVYVEICKEWANWLYEKHPRTHEGGLSHLTCEADNAQELWDDTLFMSVLFLAKAGVVWHKSHYIDEAIYQFLLHSKYLLNKETGFWYHGWTFDGYHNFVKAQWARGNSWITIFIPEFLDICKDYAISQSVYRYMINILTKQLEALCKVQDQSGLWHTLLDHKQSYVETSASAGFIYGIFKAMNSAIIDYDQAKDKYTTCAMKATDGVLTYINEAGVLEQVSGGTAMGKDSLDFYLNIPIEPKPYGQAMAMLACVEALDFLERNDS